VASEIRFDSGQKFNQTGTMASKISGTMATEIQLNLLARYQRNAWLNITEMGGTMASELSRLGWRVVSGGTDSHLLLLDTWNGGKKNEKGAGAVSGKEASLKLERKNIIVNMNAIPFDTRLPNDPSGIRLGGVAETTRGRKEKDFIHIAKSIDNILREE
jgi:glycine hydroxymethyltransferase